MAVREGGRCGGAQRGAARRSEAIEAIEAIEARVYAPANVTRPGMAARRHRVHKVRLRSR
jgi:hypothetical protein